MLISKKTFFIFFSLFLLTGCHFSTGKAQQEEVFKTADEYTPSELDSMGVNTNHLFVFTTTAMTYNGTPFMIGQTIDEMVEVFGPYDRIIDDGFIYVWDAIGVKMATYDPMVERTNRVNSIRIYWNLDFSGDSSPTNDEFTLQRRAEMRENNVRHYFQGNVLIDGVPLGRGMTIKPFLAELRKRKSNFHFSNNPFPVLYRAYFYDFDYEKTSLRWNRVFEMTIRVTSDHSDIEQLAIASVYDEGNIRKQKQ